MKLWFCILSLVLCGSFLQAKTPGEINNFLKQAIIPELKGEKISVSSALSSVDKIVGLKSRKIALSVAVAQKADQTLITLNLENVSAYDAIRTICDLSGLQFTFKRDQILIY